MNKVYQGVFVVFVLGLLACSYRLYPLPSQRDLNLMKDYSPMLPDSIELSQGSQLYAMKCGKCHYLYRPHQFREEVWRTQVQEMAARSHLDSAGRIAVLQYLLTIKKWEEWKKKN